MELSKKELLVECDKLGITKYKSKCKDELLKLINAKNDTHINNSSNVLVKIKDTDTHLFPFSL